jgi:NAD(P)-dependent dehydrogenase (short-subunit alcohol dehydrogenase family)
MICIPFSRFGVGLDAREHKRRAKKRLNARKHQEMALDRTYKDKTRLRAERLAHLNSLMQQGSRLLIPDGPSERADLGSTGAGGAGGAAAGSMLNDVPAEQQHASGKSGASDATGASSFSSFSSSSSNASSSNASSSSSNASSSSSITTNGNNKEGDGETLHRPRSCYICKSRFYRLHHFYDQLCPPCAELNYTRRTRTCDLAGRVCLVTGGRVKIGYQVVLKLLRSNATVIATTRFPRDAAARYAKEQDHDQWSGRLHIFGLDFRFIPGVEAFCTFLCGRFDRLDAIINNATQTVRRPPAYYAHLIGAERQPLHLLPPAQQSTLRSDKELGEQREHTRRLPVLGGGGGGGGGGNPGRVADIESSSSSSDDGNVRKKRSHAAPVPAAQASKRQKTAAATTSGADHIDLEVDASVGGETDQTSVQTNSASLSSSSSSSSSSGAGADFGNLTSADMSQVQLQQGDGMESAAGLFPENQLNQSGQQVDLRTHNSWLLKLDEVQTPELLEVLTINTMAPFILNGRLKKLMCSPACRGVDRYIVNVSAMEGKFYRFKTPNHPHTNMAKAAINMMTRTSSSDYAKSRIYMNAVDTGWINDENPLEKAQRVFKTHDFQTPIDEIDAAGRILDPVFSGILDGCKEHGKFYKDYKETEW